MPSPFCLLMLNHCLIPVWFAVVCRKPIGLPHFQTIRNERGSHASGKVLDFLLKIPGLGHSWKLKLKVLESPRYWKALENYNWKSHIFILTILHTTVSKKFSDRSTRRLFIPSLLNLFWKQLISAFCYFAEVSEMDYTLNLVSKWCFFVIFKHLWATKRSWKISSRGSWKSLGCLCRNPVRIICIYMCWVFFELVISSPSLLSLCINCCLFFWKFLLDATKPCHLPKLFIFICFCIFPTFGTLAKFNSVTCLGMLH